MIFGTTRTCTSLKVAQISATCIVTPSIQVLFDDGFRARVEAFKLLFKAIQELLRILEVVRCGETITMSVPELD